MNKKKIANLGTKGLFSLMMVGGAAMYFINYDEVAATITTLGFPTWIIYPLAIAKLLGLVAIWTKKSKTLYYFAYAGFMYDLLLAIGAHVAVADGEWIGALVALTLVSAAFFTDERPAEL